MCYFIRTYKLHITFVKMLFTYEILKLSCFNKKKKANLNTHMYLYIGKYN